MVDGNGGKGEGDQHSFQAGRTEEKSPGIKKKTPGKKQYIYSDTLPCHSKYTI